VGLLVGDATFEDDHAIRIADGGGEVADITVTAGHVVIAVGTRPARPTGVDFDDRRVIDSDGILRLEHPIPRTMTIVGAGVIGVEYTSMFASMGIQVTLVDARDRLLPSLDRDIAVALQFLSRRRNATPAAPDPDDHVAACGRRSTPPRPAARATARRPPRQSPEGDPCARRTRSWGSSRPTTRSAGSPLTRARRSGAG
jgi:NAD(P) transhydrogenase